MPAGPQYMGCFKDTCSMQQNCDAGFTAVPYRILPTVLANLPRGDNSNYPQGLNQDLANVMSKEVCTRLAVKAGFNYFGMEGTGCYGGNSLPSAGISTNCNSPCPGNSTQTCGGIWSMSVWGTNINPLPSPGRFGVLAVCRSLLPSPSPGESLRHGPVVATCMAADDHPPS